jgi:hypothetical protein
MNEIIQPEIKRLFNIFFEDKYNLEARETIFEDLFDLVRNNLVDEIYFCLFDSIEQKIIGGYSLKISSNQIANLIEPKNIEPSKQNLSSNTEKFLIIKVNEKEITASVNLEIKLNELTNKWDFFRQPDIKIKAEKKQLLWIDDTKIELQEVNNA